MTPMWGDVQPGCCCQQHLARDFRTPQWVNVQFGLVHWQLPASSWCQLAAAGA